jgi:hypothetical protein
LFAQGEVEVEELACVEAAGVGPDQVCNFALVGAEVIEDGGGGAVECAFGVHLVVELEFMVGACFEAVVLGLECEYLLFRYFLECLAFSWTE